MDELESDTLGERVESASAPADSCAELPMTGRTQDALRALARLLVRDEHLAEDIVQDAWLVVLQRRGARLSNPRTWLAAVVRNTAQNRRRQRARWSFEELPEGLADEPEPAGEGLLARAQEVVRDAAVRLDPPYEEVVRLRFFEGLSVDAIARRLGRRPVTVRSQLSRAVAELRAGLERRHGERSQWSALLAPLAAGRGRLASIETRAVGATAGSSLALVALVLVAFVSALAWVLTSSATRAPRDERGAGLAPLPTQGEELSERTASLGTTTRPIAVRATTRDASAADHADPARVLSEGPPDVVAQADVSASAAPVIGRLVVDVLSANGEPLDGPVSVLVGRSAVTARAGARRVVAAERSPVIVELFESDLEESAATRVVHLRATSAARAASAAAIVTIATGERRLELRTRGPAAGLAITVVDEDGCPVRGATIAVGPSGRPGRVESAPGVALVDTAEVGVTDEQGVSWIEGLPRLKRSLRVLHPRYMEYAADLALDQAARPIRIVLQRGATIRGRVTGTDGAPAAGVLARIEESMRSMRGGEAQTARTDEGGVFELHGQIPGMPVHVFVRDPARPELLASAIIEPRLGDPTLHPLRLEAHAGLDLVITDEEGAPCVDRRVALAAAAGHARYAAVEFTDQRGHVRFDQVPSVPLDVIVERHPGDYATSARGLHSGPELRSVVCHGATPRTGGLFGAVLDTDGAPPRGGEVIGYRRGEVMRLALVPKDGTFRASGLAPGNYLLYATTPDLGAHSLGTYEVHPAADTDVGIVTLQAATLVQIDVDGGASSSKDPRSIEFMPVDTGMRPIDVVNLTSHIEALMLLPGAYRSIDDARKSPFEVPVGPDDITVAVPQRH